ncbi:hypothetical protein MRS76_00185 [Rhizobiaceae bacterium n13]|uniref:Uncharacterized protein n=1 Tax=Ferirhizobium litorale TaxID=2927786 RepID=A0AAE3QBU8_9HYPH|nr:hypothetical protein [Fererhizobium litorale]MDI7860358.1 hypothetical protein [Fererhizobium litorale]MDI7920493.1 hypothetical protein [Fererhizobium litorale]
MRNPSTALPLATALACLLIAAQAGPAWSQTATDATRCPAGEKAQPATPPDRTSADGTAPGNSGSTGWTGGTGGAYIGTSPHGATEHSKTWQPPTARGLDLAMDADTPTDC